MMMSSDLYGMCSHCFTGIVPYSPRYVTQLRCNCNPVVTQDRYQISSAGGISIIDVCIDIYVMTSSDLYGTCRCSHCFNGTSPI